MCHKGCVAGKESFTRMLLRICAPLTKAFGTFENGKVTGMMAPLYQMTFDILQAMGNITMDAMEHMGDLIDSKLMKYDGCVGRLQQNLSDISTLR